MRGRRDKIRVTVGWCVIFLLISFFLVPSGYTLERRFKNVIVMVPDGCGSTHITAARWYKGASLALDRMALGGIRTYSSDSIITDSAAAATAFATGYKSSNKSIGVLPDLSTIPGVPAISESLKYKPIATVLEGAKVIGKSVGLVVTSNVQHATPAAFSAHWPDRSDYNEIGEQQVYLGLDVVFGGGKKYLVPKEKGGARSDGEDLMETLHAMGYGFVETREEMIKIKGKKVWGLFAEDHMACSLDRSSQRPHEPTLAEMTGKAIEILSKSPKGFFLVVEGSKIDGASHVHDPVGVISEVLAFDEAVRVVLDFAKKNRQTLVLAFTDHGNGGMSIGSKTTDKTYSKLPFDTVFGPLKRASRTVEGIEKILGKDSSDERIRDVIGEYYGLIDLKPDEIKTILASKKELSRVLGPMMSKRSHIGWTTSGHTGEDVFFYHYGYPKTLGMVENSEIAYIIARALGFDLKMMDNRLLAPAEEVFKKTGAALSIDRTRPEKAMLVVEKGEKRAEFPFGKNLMRFKPSGKEFAMEGITVLSPKTGKVYLPKQGALLFEKGTKR